MKTKIDIISGFLGAGKTTLIKKLVTEEYKDEKVVVIENEFGKVNIDGVVLKNSGIIVQEITSGCICCSLAGDFIDSVMQVKEKFNPDRIIIEPTGVARLSEILDSCNDRKYSGVIYLNNVITVVDVKRFKYSILSSKDFIDNQIRYTKSVILSKIGEANMEAVAAVIDYIKNIKPKVKIVNVEWDKVTAHEILSTIEENPDEMPKDKEAKVIGAKVRQYCNDTPFTSLEIETFQYFSRRRIESIFSQLSNEAEYGAILRGKGILAADNDKSIKFDYVTGELSFEDYDFDEKGRVCIIGSNLNKDRILSLFE